MEVSCSMVTIGADLLEAIKKAASIDCAQEICGLLVGHNSTPGSISITDIVSSRNIVSNLREKQFEIDPTIRIRVERRLRDQESKIVGHYHSHPRGAAYPSKKDLESAYEPDLLWMIIGMKACKVEEVRIWRLNAEKIAFRPIQLCILS